MQTSPVSRATLILNGKSADDEALRAAVMAARRQGRNIGVRVTWEVGDAERYVAEAIDDGVDVIIAAGGDGTLSEVATALAHRDAHAGALPSLALVPMGTANDFATAASIPTDPAEALDLIASLPALPIDLLRLVVNDATHWAANLASGGFGTTVTTETHEGLKKMLGGLAYVITGLGKLGSIEPLHARLVGDGFRYDGPFIALGIGNGRQAGGGQVLCPDACIDDGLLDLTIVPPLQGEWMSTLGSVLVDGKDAALDRVAVRAKLASVQIVAAQPITLNLDGEPVEGTDLRIDCVPGRVRMHLPAGCVLRRTSSDGSSAAAA